MTIVTDRYSVVVTPPSDREASARAAGPRLRVAECARATETGGRSDSPQNSHGGGKVLRIDYLSGTGRMPETPCELVDFLSSALEDEFSFEEHPFKIGTETYTHLARSTTGALLRWYFGTDDQGGRSGKYWLTLSGGPLEHLGLEEQVCLLSSLTHGYQFRATRIDTAIDDFSRTFPLAEAAKAADCDVRNFSGARKSKVIRSDEGTTIYLGGSRKKLRIYDTLQTHENIDAIRVELQLREDYSKALQHWLTEPEAPWHTGTPQGLAELSHGLAGFVTNAFSFCDRTRPDGEREKNVTRCPLLPWWAEFVSDILSHAKISVHTAKVNLQKKVQWLERTVVKTLLVFRRGLNKKQFSAWLEDFMGKNEDRLTKHDYAMIDQLLNYPKYNSACTPTFGVLQ